VAGEDEVTPAQRAFIEGAKHAFTAVIDKIGAGAQVASAISEQDAPHFKLSGDVLRQHLKDAHYKDAELLADASDKTMGSSHVRSHNASESKQETIESEEVVLQERAISKDGSMRIKLMRDGWGSSAFYPEEVIKRDGPKVFPKGTKMYADHPGVLDEKNRPERSIKDIAAVTTSDAAWDVDPKGGRGLYANAKVVDTWRPQIESLAEHIGTSIRAMGTGSRGERDGRTGLILEKFTSGKSIDFVTEAGADGKIISLAESARSRATEEDAMTDENKELTEARTKLKEAEDKLAEERTARRRSDERLILRETADAVRTLLAKAKIAELTKQRIVETVSSNPPLKDGKLDQAALETAVADAIKSEVKYLAEVTGSGKVKGLGAAAEPSEGDFTAKLTESFMAMGHDEKTAKVMAGVGKGN
jgi:hypothetical protein